jgi:hypothetical protein
LNVGTVLYYNYNVNKKEKKRNGVIGMRERYWYVITGLIHGQDDVFVSVSKQHALQPTKEKAQEELRAILSEALQDAEDNDYTFHYSLENDRLTLELNDVDYEVWRIHTVKRN